MSESSGNESRSLLGKLLADDWVAQLFSLGLFLDLCLACLWNIRLLDLKTLEPLKIVGVGPGVVLLFGYVLFSRAVAPSLHYVIQSLAWNWLCSKHSSGGAWAHRVRDLALREKDSGLFKLWEQHEQRAERAKAAEAAHWVLGLVVAANMICGLFYPTLSASLYQIVALDGFMPTLARAVLFFAFIGVVLRSGATLIIDDHHDKMRNLPREIEAKLQEHSHRESGIAQTEILSTPPTR